MKAKYALRAMCVLAETPDAAISARELAERSLAPEKFLEAILLDLRRGGFVHSKRGARGGHALARPAVEIMVGDVIRSIDGPLAPVRCASVSDYRACTDCPSPGSCQLRALMREARDALSHVLDRRSLADFSRSPPSRMAPAFKEALHEQATRSPTRHP